MIVSFIVRKTFHYEKHVVWTMGYSSYRLIICWSIKKTYLFEDIQREFSYSAWIFLSPIHTIAGLLTSLTEQLLLTGQAIVPLQLPIKTLIIMSLTKAYAAYDAITPLRDFNFQRRETGPKDVQIEILYCGVCHSDIHQVRNEWNNALGCIQVIL